MSKTDSTSPPISGDLVRAGRAWVFGDNINTDLIFPNRAFKLPQDEQPQLVFSANRPGWVDLVEPGDLLVAGENFGMGSGRAIGRLFRDLGIGGVIASSFNGLGFRNCISYGMPAITYPDILNVVNEGDHLSINFTTGELRNDTTEWSAAADPLPPELLSIATAGGVIEMLMAEGLLASSSNITLTSKRAR